MFYDPMIAKLITWAPTRLEAIDAQVAALDQFVIDGISDNVDFLSALMQHPRYRDGNITTGFIAEEYPEGFEGAPADAQLIEDLTAIAGMVLGHHRRARGRDRPASSGRRSHPSCERVVKIAAARRTRYESSHYKGGNAGGHPTTASSWTSSGAGCRASGC